MTIHTTTARATRLLTRAAATAPSLRRARPGNGALDHSSALAENGFTVFRGLFSETECAELAADLKADAGITEGVAFTKIDATNCFRTARELLLEGRMVDAARVSTGSDVRFLQVSDLHYRHDTAAWHRDGAHRAADASTAPDWSDPGTPYRVVKAVVYLETVNAGMGFLPGSHRSPIEMDHVRVRGIEAAGEQTVVAAGADPNRRLTAAHNGIPLVWTAGTGDVLVYDQRVFHAGRRVATVRGTLTDAARKVLAHGTSSCLIFELPR